ncbi:phosphonate ABC transporter ATP-binding protein [Alteribacter lacisalsi]|uniref:Phosphonate ABC transporter ATP-binding protein n=1 Tax=Alteribacter lacisalsi TaxID=2045244 RepID=A0A2W0HG15_9BACI|nr:phosphonate ABC transporter ATP-binding protein [Alteribacter lacisalsi]PYZ96325.1 phosphonate ABC transporter ATP-binding protein [Alteribacter lacisalsi]
MNAITVNNVTKTFRDGTTALSDVSFTVNPGEGVILLGHNGSGKSTLFKCISGFEKPTSGEILYGDKDITRLSKRKFRPIRKKLGMVFQNFHLIYNLSVFQNVLFGAMGNSKTFLHTLSFCASDELRMKAMECLDRVGLAHLAGRRADQLSGGQQQRVAIARMLMQDPEVVLADEPIASLDPRAGREVMELLWEIVRERHLTVVCILHQTEVALEYGERFIGLHSGKLVMDQVQGQVSKEELSTLYNKESSFESFSKAGASHE